MWKVLSVMIFFKNLLLEFVRYNFWLVLLVFAFGRVIRLILLFKNLHSFSASLHLYHEWWYYFNGYSYKEERIVEYDLIYVKAIIDTKNRTVLYNGYLMNFETIGKQLDRIYLANVSTMELKDLDQRIDDQSDILLTPNREYTLSLKYEHITHLSVEFIVLVNDQLRQGHN